MIILSALGGTVAALPLNVVYISLCSATRLYNYGGYISHAFCYENTIALYFGGSPDTALSHSTLHTPHPHSCSTHSNFFVHTQIFLSTLIFFVHTPIFHPLSASLSGGLTKVPTHKNHVNYIVKYTKENCVYPFCTSCDIVNNLNKQQLIIINHHARQEGCGEKTRRRCDPWWGYG